MDAVNMGVKTDSEAFQTFDWIHTTVIDKQDSFGAPIREEMT